MPARLAGVGTPRRAAAPGKAAIRRPARARAAGREPQRFEHGRAGGARQILGDRVLSLAREPPRDELGSLAVARAVAYGRRQHRKSNGDCDLGDLVHDPDLRIDGQARGLELVVRGPEERGLLHAEQRFVTPQQLSGERMALGELSGPATPPGPDLRGERCDGDFLHPIFSMFTKNALNSGVRALASPTNGVSALASQLAPLVGSRSAVMPTKPQWIGIPM